MICPSCAAPLTAARGARAVLWHCSACGGLAATLAALRSVAAADLVAQAWSAAQESCDAGRPCPSCRTPMREVDAPPSGSRIDLCTRCQLSWFDAGEFETLSAAPLPEAPVVSVAARDAAARLAVQSLGDQAAAAGTIRSWQAVADMLWLIFRVF